MDEKKERPKIIVKDRRRVKLDPDDPHLAVAPGQPAAGRPDDAPAEDGDQPQPSSEGLGSDATELERARAQAAEYLEHLQRLKAEFDNYRKRVLKEQTRAVEMASEPLVRRLLEVLDDFDLALMAAEKKPDFDTFLHGVEMVYAKLQDILRSEGLERMRAQGDPFDPERHEALMQTGPEEGEPHVADVFRQGYTLKGRVIRPAGVKVARKD
jgi:molecular chaperone GrpE